MKPARLFLCLTLVLACAARAEVASGAGAAAGGGAGGHWAWRPLVEFGRGESIDGFVRRRLAQEGLALSPGADRRTLIRRLTFDLHGLPPEPEAVEAFVRDRDPRAYEKLVERLLASPHYGERYARHWLDIAHYADTHGFERDRRRPHAWRYRDYVIEALNRDKPYDRFLREQIAGDILWPEEAAAVIATGFLAAGPWDYVGQVETKSPELRRAARSLDLDDMVTQVMAATVGLTVNCARCHDHKLDPIPQEDYYALRAVFAGLRRGDRPVPLAERGRLEAARGETAAEIYRLDPGLDLADIVGGGDGTGRGGVGRGIDPRTGKPESRRMGYLGDVVANRFAPSAERFVDGAFIPSGGDGSVAIPVSSTGLSARGLPSSGAKAWDAIRNGPVNSQHSPELGGVVFGAGGESLLGLHANAGITFDLAEARAALGAAELRFSAEVGYFGHLKDDAYADAHVLVDGEVAFEVRGLKRAQGLRAVEVHLPAGARFLTLVSTDGGNGISMDQIGFGRPVLRPSRAALPARRRDRLALLRRRLRDLEAEIAALGDPVVYAVVAGAEVPEVRVLRRGDPESPTGAPLPPRAPSFLTMLEPDLGRPGTPEGERRAALARWVNHPDNPLTARVIANRVWHWHFGRGLVDTPSDFGRGGGRPSHPELLDWLAGELVRRGWSLKALHRLILNSATYRQASRHGPGERGGSVDARNRLLWRQNPRRIEAEAVRDAVLLVSGKLNRRRGGPGFEDFRYREAYAPEYTYITADAPALWRRSIYRYLVRATPDRFLATLDCPDPANLTPVRHATTTPLQSLALYNNDFMLRQARHFAGRVEREAGPGVGDQVTRAFGLAFGRRPSAEEHRGAVKLVRGSGLFTLCRALYNANEFVYVD